MPSSTSSRSRSTSASRRSASARRRSAAEREAASILAAMAATAGHNRLVDLAHVASLRLPRARRRRVVSVTSGRIGRGRRRARR